MTFRSTHPLRRYLRLGARFYLVVGLLLVYLLIVVYGLLPQKHELRPVDFELFELLGGHAATALCVSKLHAASKHRGAVPEGLVDLSKPNASNEVGQGSPHNGSAPASDVGP